MRSHIVISVFTLAAQVYAEESADKLLDRLSTQKSEAGSHDSTELENTMLAKPGDLTISRGSPTANLAKTAPGLMKQPRSAQSAAARAFSHWAPDIPHPNSYKHWTPDIPQGKDIIGHSTQKVGPARTRGAVATRAHWTDKENNFHYGHVDVAYDELPAEDVEQMRNNGWIILDVRHPEQVEKAAIDGAVEVPLYVVKNDMKSPMGIYQEMVSFGLGGWWMGGRPMKENQDFVKQVQQKLGRGNKGIIVVCQTGLRSKQAVKELHLAGYPKLALLKGGLNTVRHNELPCAEEGCRLDLAGSGNVAGMLGWHAN